MGNKSGPVTFSKLQFYVYAKISILIVINLSSFYKTLNTFANYF
jgi:hypothetical protein